MTHVHARSSCINTHHVRACGECPRVLCGCGCGCGCTHTRSNSSLLYFASHPPPAPFSPPTSITTNITYIHATPPRAMRRWRPRRLRAATQGSCSHTTSQSSRPLSSRAEAQGANLRTSAARGGSGGTGAPRSTRPPPTSTGWELVFAPDRRRCESRRWSWKWVWSCDLFFLLLLPQHQQQQ